jgi:hypothetical protein
MDLIHATLGTWLEACRETIRSLGRTWWALVMLLVTSVLLGLVGAVTSHLDVAGGFLYSMAAALVAGAYLSLLAVAVLHRRPVVLADESMDRHWCDFNAIEKATFVQYGTPRLYAAGLLSRAFLEREIRAGDVVVTHHLPHWNSVQPQFAGNPTNRYYVHDVSDLLESRAAKLWIHGHVHSAWDYSVGDTRVLCNPRGYPGETDSGFRSGLVVQV